DADIFEASDIWIMNADGSGKTNLTKDKQSNWGASWAPDGKHILFNSAREGGIPHLYLMTPDSSDLRRLCPNSNLWEEYADWSPDGTRLLFLHSLPNGGEIWIMNADGSAQTKLMDAYGFGDSPVWQP